ncbi:hypothetical protein GCM10009557_69210 [Virgisporangium ochraceum]|uniref:Potassium/proton antiporter subunit KhtT-like N-terminal domain-containing protein n=1 Tax=Virgisporangium ochraceum TaxID=65505 RepID=A0A8J4EEG3_9ACTN|nr:cation:proton antiporter regulatory subunit [Virgisporangium ochraceum]GIJ72550.1 hypothetical protein Voc01_074670 [Virgisporangium ochraceum]
MNLERTALLAVGTSYTFTTAAGQPAAVIVHGSGRRDVVVYDREDPDRIVHTLVLDGGESRTVAELLGLPLVMDRMTDLPAALDGVEAVRMPVPVGSPFAGRPLGDARARSRTGASIVAVGDRPGLDGLRDLLARG